RLLGLGLVGMLGRRRRGTDVAGRIPALLTVLGAAVAAWVVLVTPGRPLTAAVFPVVDVLLLVVVAQLVVVHGARRPALWLVGAATGALFSADLLRVLGTDGLPAPAAVPGMLRLLAFLALGTAALHPT